MHGRQDQWRAQDVDWLEAATGWGGYKSQGAEDFAVLASKLYTHEALWQLSQQIGEVLAYKCFVSGCPTPPHMCACPMVEQRM